MGECIHNLNRRRLLEVACWGGVSSSVLPKLGFAQLPITNKRLVFVLLRGAMDGLHAVVPFGDPAYISIRGALAYDSNALGHLDGFFGLAPGLKPLLSDYFLGELVAVQAVAIPYRTRSHFDAQSILETGMDKPIGSASGWLNRAIEVLGGHNGTGLAVGNGMPQSMMGRVPVGTWAPGKSDDASALFDDTLAQLYQMDPMLADSYTAAQTLQQQSMTMDMGMDMGMGMGMGMGTSQRGGLGQFEQLFAATANFLNDPEGPRVAALEFSGWDTHAHQGLTGGSLDRRLEALANGMKRLKSGLTSEVWRDTVVVVATEFGRTAEDNGNGGTDHGTAGTMLLYGGSVNGGVLADWPGLGKNQLYEARDLRPTLDTRAVLKSLLAGHFDMSSQQLSNHVFPDSSQVTSSIGII